MSARVALAMSVAMIEEVQQKIEDAAAEVFEQLGGAGYAENIYQRALQIELKIRGLESSEEVPCVVLYKSRAIGVGRIDLLVHEPTVVIELKAIQRLNVSAEKQLNGYMRAMGASAGVLVNFGPDAVECKRLS